MESENKIPEIRSATRQIVRELNLLGGFFSDGSLSYTQCHVLFELDKRGRLRLMELCDLLLLDKSTLSRVTKILLEKGLIQSKANPEDKRERWLQLTPEGALVTSNNNRAADEQVASTLALLSQSETPRVAEGLHLYARALYKKRKQKGIEIRAIREEDNRAVADLIKSVMIEYGNVGTGYSINDPEIENMSAAYAADNAAFFVITRNEQILGCGGIGPLRGEETVTCELRKMYFYPGIRGIGLGSRLVKICLNQARQFGYRECYLETVERMWQANLLYHKMGFTKLSCPRGNTGHTACETYYSLQLVDQHFLSQSAYPPGRPKPGTCHE